MTKKKPLEISNDVPLPTVDSGNVKYPFEGMSVGDSFYCESGTVRSAASGYGIRHGVKFLTRKEGDGFRVWRSE